MLVTKFVEVCWNGETIKHYKSLGYTYTKRFDKFTIPVEHLSKGSTVRVTIQCPDCLAERQVRYKEYCTYKDNCAPCSLSKVNKKLHADPEFRRRNSESMTRVNEIYKEKIRAVAKSRIGPLHPNWKPERTREQRVLARNLVEYVEWAKSVKKKDKYLCQCCFQNNNTLVSHHLMAYASYPELRFEVSSGITLCSKCHKEFHKMYGKGKNTKQQFEEFISERTG